MITDIHKKLVNGETTSVKLTEKYLGAIAEKDGEVGAFLSVRREEALREAQEVDKKIQKGEEIGVLAGIPCAIKDNMCLAGGAVTAASKMLENYTAPYDATVVSRLKETGAVILGKTNMDEFAMGASTETSAYTKTKNPRDLSRVPGGSSGGSAAAVAGGEAPWALGSDTGGSIRQPAALCGCVGLKPTYGRVSRWGLLAMASSLDQIGPITNTVEDAAIVLSAIAGEDARDATSAQSPTKDYTTFLTGEASGLTIGIPKEWMAAAGLDARIRATIEEATKRFEKLGAKVREVSMPMMEYALAVYYVIVPSEVSSNMARYDGMRYGLSLDEGTVLDKYEKTRAAGLGDEVKRRIMLGTYALSAGYYDAYYKKAQKVRTLIRRDFEKTFEGVDLIFGPTTPEVAFKFGAKTDDPLTMYLSDIYTVTANLAGVPAISFPIGEVMDDGALLPVGGQLLGKWFDEEGVLRAVDAYERSGK